MRKLSPQEKIRVMDNVIEPALADLDASVIAACMEDLLKGYLNSDDYANDDIESRVTMIHSAGTMIRMIDRLGSNYED